jgi:hypothetical protein
MKEALYMEEKPVPKDIAEVVERIAKSFSPQKIYLFSHKRGQLGRSAGFKLCVVIECDNLEHVERQIYLKIDSEVPYDLVLYTPEMFGELLARKGSFAGRVAEKGRLVYG